MVSTVAFNYNIFGLNPFECDFYVIKFKKFIKNLLWKNLYEESPTSV